MATSETRLALLNLVHRHGLTPKQVIDHVREYEKFLDEGQSDAPAVTVKPAAPKKGGGAVPKGGDPSK